MIFTTIAILLMITDIIAIIGSLFAGDIMSVCVGLFAFIILAVSLKIY